MATINERIEDAIDEAGLAFWEVIAKHFPEIESGDLSPFETKKFYNALRETVDVWYRTNVDVE